MVVMFSQNYLKMFSKVSKLSTLQQLCVYNLERQPLKRKVHNEGLSIEWPMLSEFLPT